MAELEPMDRAALERAANLLERLGVAARLTNAIGAPIERSLDVLPAAVSHQILRLTQRALGIALNAALVTIDTRHEGAASNTLHKWLAGTAGAVGGAFGLPALAIELPVSTTLMLRSIADIARSEGEDIKDVRTKLACMEVFALGGRSFSKDDVESRYFAIRAALAGSMREAAKYAAEKGIAEEGAPVLIRLVNQIASRFGLTVSEKVAAQAIPFVGALGGGAINLVFMDHFQDMAHGHFIVRRLERKYGPELIQLEYDRIRRHGDGSAER